MGQSQSQGGTAPAANQPFEWESLLAEAGDNETERARVIKYLQARKEEIKSEPDRLTNDRRLQREWVILLSHLDAHCRSEAVITAEKAASAAPSPARATHVSDAGADDDMDSADMDIDLKVEALAPSPPMPSVLEQGEGADGQVAPLHMTEARSSVAAPTVRSESSNDTKSVANDPVSVGHKGATAALAAAVESAAHQQETPRADEHPQGSATATSGTEHKAKKLAAVFESAAHQQEAPRADEQPQRPAGATPAALNEGTNSAEQKAMKAAMASMERVAKGPSLQERIDELEKQVTTLTEEKRTMEEETKALRERVLELEVPHDGGSPMPTDGEAGHFGPGEEYHGILSAPHVQAVYTLARERIWATVATKGPLAQLEPTEKVAVIMSMMECVASAAETLELEFAPLGTAKKLAHEHKEHKHNDETAEHPELADLDASARKTAPAHADRDMSPVHESALATAGIDDDLMRHLDNMANMEELIADANLDNVSDAGARISTISSGSAFSRTSMPQTLAARAASDDESEAHCPPSPRLPARQTVDLDLAVSVSSLGGADMIRAAVEGATETDDDAEMVDVVEMAVVERAKTSSPRASPALSRPSPHPDTRASPALSRPSPHLDSASVASSLPRNLDDGSVVPSDSEGEGNDDAAAEAMTVVFDSEKEEAAALAEAMEAVEAGEPESSADEDEDGEKEPVTEVGCIVEATVDVVAVKVGDSREDLDACDDLDLTKGCYYRILEDLDEEEFYFGIAETGPNIGKEGYIPASHVIRREDVSDEDIARINADDAMEKELAVKTEAEVPKPKEDDDGWRHFVDDDHEEVKADATTTASGGTGSGNTMLTRSNTSDSIKRLATIANKVVGGNVSEKKEFETSLQRAVDGDETLHTLNLSNTQRIFQAMCEAERTATLAQIIKAVQTTVCLESVELSNAGLTDPFVVELANALKENDSISKVVLDTNDIRGPGFSALADMLLINRSIRRLCASNQQMAVPTVVQHKLVDSIKANGHITTCSIDFHDATARDNVGKTLLRNADNIRRARLAAREATAATRTSASSNNTHSANTNKPPPPSNKPSLPNKPSKDQQAGRIIFTRAATKQSPRLRKSTKPLTRNPSSNESDGLYAQSDSDSNWEPDNMNIHEGTHQSPSPETPSESESHAHAEQRRSMFPPSQPPKPNPAPKPTTGIQQTSPDGARQNKAQSQLEMLREKKRLRELEAQKSGGGTGANKGASPVTKSIAPTPPDSRRNTDVATSSPPVTVAEPTASTAPGTKPEGTTGGGINRGRRGSSTRERLALWEHKVHDGEAGGDVTVPKVKRTGKVGFHVEPTADKCVVCTKRVYLNEKVSVDGHIYHKSCFRCSVSECKKLLSPGTYAAMDGTMFCKPCFKKMFKLKGNYDEGFGKEQHKMKWVHGEHGASDAVA
eukprot:m.181394 g.181394  ORF g.181394 m.181394 type:complete len:1417 (-) comp15248_c0_seq1:41-4291(-)